MGFRVGLRGSQAMGKWGAVHNLDDRSMWKGTWGLMRRWRRHKEKTEPRPDLGANTFS